MCWWGNFWKGACCQWNISWGLTLSVPPSWLSGKGRRGWRLNQLPMANDLVNHPSCVWLYIFYLRVLYVFWLYIQLIPLWFLKCLISLFSDACSLCHQVSSHWRIRLIYLICCSDVICRARAKGVCVWISWYLMTSVSLFLYITWLLRILDMLLDFR